MSGRGITFGDVRGSGCSPAPLELPHWYALRTRARAEKKTEALLRAAGIESYAAVARVDRVWSDRTQTVGMPLFSGYIFVRIALIRAVDALRWPGAVELVKTRGVPTPLRQEEMDAVRRLAEGVSESRSLPIDVDYMAEGARVRVKDGPFRGMGGTLVEVRGGPYVVVRIAALRQAKGVKIARSLLQLQGVSAA